MPAYDYSCKVCGHIEERRFSFTDVPDVIGLCPECQYSDLRKVLYPAAVSFKGSGFYRTDSRTQHVRTQAHVGGVK